jgi:hypothetical protein
MDRDSTEPATIAVDRGRQDLLEGPELLGESRLQVERVLDLGNCSNHVLPVLSGLGRENSAKLEKQRKRAQPALRLIVNREDFFEVPRRYGQSTSGRSDSHVTTPADSRSISTARDSPHGRRPYATLRKWPNVVRHLFAKADCSSDESVLRNSLSSMETYHHTVIEKATPFREFTGQCVRRDNPSMDIKELPSIRRANLRRFVDARLEGNLSELARRYRPDNPRPSFFSDLLRGKKNFGEKLAYELEICLELKIGQLSIKDSLLEMREIRRDHLAEDIKAQVEDLTPTEKHEALRLIVEIKNRRKTKRSA